MKRLLLFLITALCAFAGSQALNFVQSQAYAADTISYTLSPGASAEITAMAGSQSIVASVKVSGGPHEYARYYDSGASSTYGKYAGGQTHSISGTFRLILTNTSGSPITVTSGTTKFNIVYSPTPALRKTTIWPDQSVDVTSNMGQNSDVRADGYNDYAKFDKNGELVTYAKKRAAGEHDLPAGNRVALTNRDTKAYEVYGPYETLQFSSRSVPAVYYKTLSPGQSLDAVNITGKSFSLSVGGIYDNAIYEEDGSIYSYGRKKSSSSTLSVASGYRASLTNTDTKSYEVAGPYDGFRITDRSEPASFVATLGTGQSIQALNKTPKSFSLSLSGTYDYAEYAKTGAVAAVGRGVKTTTNAISSGSYLAVTNQGATVLEVAGPYDGFTVSGRSTPALALQVLQPGQHMEATNTNASGATLTLSGTFDYATYKSGEGIVSYARGSKIGSLPMESGKRAAFSNTGSTAAEVFGAYDAFTFAGRANPVTFTVPLNPGQTMEAVNRSSGTFSLTATASADYAEYKANGAVTAFERNKASGSNSVASQNRIVFTNSSGTGLTVTGPYDAFQAGIRSNPALVIKTLGPGQSMEATNKSPESANLKTLGTYDYIQKSETGDITSFDRGRTLSYLTTPAGNPVGITNASLVNVEVSGPFDTFQVTDRANPVLFIKPMQPGQSVDITNRSAKTYRINTVFSGDAAEYKPDGTLSSYEYNGASGISLIEAGKRIGLMNTSDKSGEVWGPFDMFAVNDRNTPVTFTKALSPGQTLKAKQIAASSFSVRRSGVTDYALYKLTGAISSYGRSDSGAMLRSVGSGETLIVTNSDQVSVLVKGPYDAFQLSDRAEPALFVKSLSGSQSVDVTNITAASATLSITGNHDYTTYDGQGPIKSYASGTTATRSLDAGERIGVAGTDGTAVEAAGPYDVFRVSDRSKPVTYTASLSSGQTVQAQSITDKTFYVKVAGKYDYAKYSAPKTVAAYDRASTYGTIAVEAGNFTQVTGADPAAIKVKGAYEAFTWSTRQSSALVMKSIAPGQNIDVVNTGLNATSVTAGGTFDYVQYKTDGNVQTYGHGTSSSTLSAGERSAYMNTDAGNIEFSGPYDMLQIADRSRPVTYVKSLTPGQTVQLRNIGGKDFYVKMTGLFDYVKYDETGIVQADNQGSSGASSILVSANKRMVVTNAAAAAIEVRVSYDAFEAADRTETAFLVKTLDPAQSVGLTNVTSGSIGVNIKGIFDYTIYNTDGSVSSYGQKRNPVTLTIGAYKRIKIVSSDTIAFQVTAPREAVEPDNGSGPVTFFKELTQGQTIRVVNNGKATYSLKMQGTADYVKTNAAGHVLGWDKQSAAGNMDVGPGDAVVLTNAGAGLLTISGSKEMFMVADRSVPALLRKSLATGTSMELTNSSGGSVTLSLAGGAYDQAKSGVPGAASTYRRGDTSEKQSLAGQQRLALTNTSAASLSVVGPYDAIQAADRLNPALAVQPVESGQSVAVINVTASAQTITFGGSFTYRKPDGTAGSGKDTLSIPAGERYVLTSGEPAAQELYGLFEAFRFESTEAISGAAAVNEIRKLDPSQTDAQSLHADPIDTATGAQVMQRTLLTVHGAIDVPFAIQYHSLLLDAGKLGTGWGHNYEARVENQGGGKLVLHWNANQHNVFQDRGAGVYESADRSVRLDKLTKLPDGGYQLSRINGTAYVFSAAGMLQELRSKQGQRIVLMYSAAGLLSGVTEPVSGKTLTLGYDANGRLSSVSDPLDRQVALAYDTGGRLTTITDAAGLEYIYNYDTNGRIRTVTEQGVRLFTNVYDPEGRVISQVGGIAVSGPTRFAYTEKDGRLTTTVTDREKNVKQLIHDARYQLVETVSEIGQRTTFAYDAQGNRTRVTDNAGQFNTFAYDTNGNLTGITDHLGQSVAMTYDNRQNLLTAIGPDQLRIANEYDAKQQLVAVTDPASNKTAYTYDANGQLIEATDARSGRTQYAYTNGLLSTVTGPTGGKVQYTYDASGRVTAIQNASSGKSTTIEYDNNDRILRVVDPLGHATSYTYNAAGQPLTSKDAKGGATSYQYDLDNRLTAVIDALGRTTKFAYDREGRMTETVDAKAQKETYGYDAKGRLTSVTNALGHTVKYEYDTLDRQTSMTDALGNRVYDVTFDGAGNPVAVKDALGRKATQQFDALNRLKQATDPLNRTTKFTYDQLNRLTNVTDAKQGTSSVVFNALSQATSISDPNRNTASYVYDAAGRLVQETNAAGGTHHYEYGIHGLPSKETNGRNQETVYTYTDNDRLAGFADPVGSVSYTYDANGNITTITSSAGKVLTRTFDALDRVESYMDEDGNTLKYAYDEVGQLTSLTYPDGKQVSYTYDAAGRMTGVTDWASRKTTYAYDANGRLSQSVRPDGSVESRTYDGAGQLTGLSDQLANGAWISRYTYTYDEAGNVTGETNALTAARTPATVSAATYGVGANAGTAGLHVTDAVYGEASDWRELGTGLLNIGAAMYADMTYSADNRLATYNGQAVTYDADGNMTFGPLAGTMGAYLYDARNRLIEAGGIRYTYDSENHRISRTDGSGTRRFVINPHAALSQLLMEQDGQGQVQARYVYGLGLIGREDSGGNYRVYHYDRRGSTVALTDLAGQVTDRYTYGPYGEVLEKQGSTPNPFLYNGRDGVQTDNNGLYYMRARYYNPEIKRFINRDVVTGSIDAGQTLNRYAYVNGNPISYVDPFGLSRDGDTSPWIQGGDFLVDALPLVGTIKGFQQAFTGTNLVTGAQLSTADRWAEGIGSALSLVPIPGLKHGGKYATKGIIAAEQSVERWLGRKTTMDFVEDTNRLGGKLYSERDLKLLGKYLEKRGVTLKVGDKHLPPNKGGAFDGSSKTLYLRSNPTQYEVWHELSHYIHYRKLGPEAYSNLPRTFGAVPMNDLTKFNAPEQFVYDMLSNTKRWSMINEAERGHANWYIDNFGGIR